MLRWLRQTLSGNTPAPEPHSATTVDSSSANAPANAPQHALLALALRHEQSGQIDEAVSACESLLVARPNDIDALCLIGKLLTQQGNLDSAAAALSKAIALNPQSTDALFFMGKLHLKRSNYRDAASCFDAILKLDSNHPGGHFGLGNIELAHGRLDAALSRFATALVHNPQYAEAHCNCGVVFESKGEPANAEAAYQRALAINPDLGNAHFNLARLFMAGGNVQGALNHIGKVVALDPKSADDWDIKGRLHQAMKDYESAKESYERALAIDPNLYEVHNNLGVIHQLMGNYEIGISSFRAALDCRPDFVSARSNLGMSLLFMGKREEALFCLREAVQAAPDEPSLYSNYLFCMSHDEKASAEEVFAAHRAFGERFEAPLIAQWPEHDNDRDPERRLRLGFVSADLYAHAVASFIEPIWSALDPEQVEIWVYANNANEDAITQRLKALPHRWQVVNSLSDAALAQQIRQDGIDILFDLSGHSAGNRLLVFARKPAPIQVSWIGNPNTTGLSAMDYYLADRFGAPPGLLDSQFTEKIVRLTCSATFLPADGAPDVAKLPALRKGSLTFGTYARSNKITDGTIALWSKVLNSVSGSNMLIGGLSDSTRKREIAEQFSRHGVMQDRIQFLPRMSMREYLASHDLVDIILDTFPFGGGTTSCHALWMGVPVLSLAGNTMPSRVGAVINGQLQLSSFTVQSETDFVARAVYWSENLSELAALRAELRSRTEASALCQPDAVAKSLEAAMRQMWQLWCGRRAAQSFSAEEDSPLLDQSSFSA